MAATAITPAQQDQRGVDLAAAHGRRPAPGQADGHDHDADHRGGEAEQDAGVAEGPVHRRGRAGGRRSGAHRLVPFGAVTRPGWAAM